MNSKRFILLGALSLSLLNSAAPAQSVATPARPEAEAAQQARAAVERKALALLEEVGGEAAGLRLVENRVRVQASVAEALWPHDEARAKELFQAALSGLASVTSSIAGDDPGYHQSAQPAHNLRREVAMMLAQRDPKLALEFLRGTRVPPPPVVPNQQYQPPDPDLMLELQLAEQVAARDPKEAVRMAEETLAKGVSGNLPSVLERVRASDAQAAARLAAEVVKKLRTSNLVTNHEAANVAAYLLRAARPAETASGPTVAPLVAVTDGAGAGVVYSAGRGLALDEQARRELIGAMVNAALGNMNDPRRGRGTPLSHVLQELLPEVERLMPAQAGALRRRLAEAQGGNAPQPLRDRGREYQQLMQTGTAEALLDAAAKAPAEMRQQLYRVAAFKALGEGSPERARQIINNGFEHAQQREQILRELDHQLFWRAAERGDVEQAQALLARFRTGEERLGMLLQLARAVAAKGNREAAERLLEDVWNQAGGRAKNQQQFFTQLQVANIYAQVSPARAFEIVEANVEQLNELVAAAAVIDGFGQEAFEQGELKGQGGYLWATLVQQTGEQLGQLAHADFDRALAAADRLQRPEARLFARLAVARGALRPGGTNQPGRVGPRRRERPVIVGPVGGASQD